MIGTPVVRVFAYSFDLGTIMTGSTDGTAQHWDLASGRPLGRPMRHSGYVRAVALSPEGKSILTGGDDRMAQLWDADSQAPLGRAMLHLAAGCATVLFVRLSEVR